MVPSHLSRALSWISAECELARYLLARGAEVVTAQAVQATVPETTPLTATQAARSNSNQRARVYWLGRQRHHQQRRGVWGVRRAQQLIYWRRWQAGSSIPCGTKRLCCCRLNDSSGPYYLYVCVLGWEGAILAWRA